VQQTPVFTAVAAPANIAWTSGFRISCSMAGLQAICAVLRGEQSPPASSFLSHAGFITPGELAELVDALAGSHAAVGLRLKACQLGDAGAAAIADALCAPTSSLTSLELPSAPQLEAAYPLCTFKRKHCSLRDVQTCRQRDQRQRCPRPGCADGVQRVADLLGPERYAARRLSARVMWMLTSGKNRVRCLPDAQATRAKMGAARHLPSSRTLCVAMCCRPVMRARLGHSSRRRRCGRLRRAPSAAQPVWPPRAAAYTYARRAASHERLVWSGTPCAIA